MRLFIHSILLLLCCSPALGDSGWMLTTADFRQQSVSLDAMADDGVKITVPGTGPSVISFNNFLQLDRLAAPRPSNAPFTLEYHPAVQLFQATMGIGGLLAIAGGADGIGWFPWNPASRSVSGAMRRVAAQIAAAVIVLASGLEVEIVGNDVLAWGIGLLWLVGITNAFNLLDNMDGLAATLAAAAACMTTMPFMSRAPRPHRCPSATSPPNGWSTTPTAKSCLQPCTVWAPG